jgi:aminopeptidase N
MLKNVLLDLIAAEDTPESHQVLREHFRLATHATDRVAALAALNRSSASDRLETLEGVYRDWHHHLSAYANYLRIIAAGTREDVFDLIERERNRSTFDITQPTWIRALFLTMATNTKMVWSERGTAWVGERVIELATINPTTASRLLNTFQHVRLLKPVLKQRTVAALERIVREITEQSSPIVYGQAKAYLQEL